VQPPLRDHDSPAQAATGFAKSLTQTSKVENPATWISFLLPDQQESMAASVQLLPGLRLPVSADHVEIAVVSVTGRSAKVVAVGKFCWDRLCVSNKNPDSRNPAFVWDCSKVGSNWYVNLPISLIVSPLATSHLSLADSEARGELAVVVNDLRADRSANGSYVDAIPAQVQLSAPGVLWVAGDVPSSGPLEASVNAGGQHADVALRSTSGTCWYAVDIASNLDNSLLLLHLPAAGTYYNSAANRPCLADFPPLSGWGGTLDAVSAPEKSTSSEHKR
jgi:hypothetical protein